MTYNIVYLDASALVKRYVEEAGSEEVRNLLEQVPVIGTAMITRVEVAAALAKATRMGILPVKEALTALEAFYEEWRFLERVHVTESVIFRASALAWEKKLRGYDATHLAAALVWQEMMETSVTMATFDRELWIAARNSGLYVWPVDLSSACIWNA